MCEFLIPVRRSVIIVRISINSSFKLRVCGDSRESLKLGGGGGSRCALRKIFISMTRTHFSSNDYIPFDSCSPSLSLSLQSLQYQQGTILWRYPREHELPCLCQERKGGGTSSHHHHPPNGRQGGTLWYRSIRMVRTPHRCRCCRASPYI